MIAIINGKIYQGENTFCSSLLIDEKSGKILKTGSDEEILKEHPKTIFDAQKQCILPGFNDSHLHLKMTGECLCDIDLHDCASIEEVQNRIKEYIEKNKPAKGTILHGIGWNQEDFIEKRFLNKNDLDQVSLDYPMIMERCCTHILCANDKALARIDPTEKDKELIDYSSGIAKENGCSYFVKLLGEENADVITKQLETAMKDCVKKGITTAATADLKDANYRKMMNIYNEIQKDPILRINHQFNLESSENILDFLKNYKESHSSFHTIGPLKLFADGSLGGRTALLKEPYFDDPSTSGDRVITEENFENLLKLACDNKLQVIVHAIGDQAIQNVLNGYKKYQDPNNALRWGIVHIQITDEKLLDQIQKQNLIGFIQPVFLKTDTSFLVDRVGIDRAKTSYAFKKMKDLNIPLSLGTDSPVEDQNPFQNIYYALKGNPYSNYTPNFSLAEAIDMYTIGSAYAQFKEKEIGLLKEGYYADLMILDEDIFTCDLEKIKEIQPVKVMINGQWKWEK